MFVGTNPSWNMIAASYNSELATDFGRKVRNVVNSKEYRALFDARLSPDSMAANRWHTSEGGMYAAVGIGSATTGRGAHVLSIDDPFKDREEADSQIHREKVWRWYTSTAYTRLENEINYNDLSEDDRLWFELLGDIESGDAKPFEGAIVLICTRWHDDDLAGRLEAQEAEGGEAWDILDLPAIKDGKALWPSKYPLPVLERIRRTIGERDWNALYQQTPTPEEGSYFKREWFRYYTEKPKHLRIYGASDYAVTEDDNDYTVHVVVGVDPEDNVYIMDLWRGQTESDIWVDAFLDMVRKWKPINWAEESGQILKSVGPFLVRMMREKKVFCAREQFTSSSDKPTRARSFQAIASMGKVYLPVNAPWTNDLLAELLAAFSGKNDDQVDALSLIGRMLDTMITASRPKTNSGRKPDKYDRAFKRLTATKENWKYA